MHSLCGFGVFGTRSRRTVVACVVVAVLAIAGGSLAGVAGAQSAQNATGVDSCTTINSSGTYVLTANVSGGANGHCLTVTASNVTVNGAGHTVSGQGSSYGIYVNGSARPVTNITVENVRTSNWSVGVFYLGVDNSTIRGMVADNNTEGIKLAQSNRNQLADNTAYANSIGIAIGGESQNNTLRQNVAVENKWGIHFERESANNTVTNNVARNNTRWDFYSLRNDGTNTVRDLQLATTTVSFTGRNVGLRDVTSPPALPRGTRSLGTFVRVIETGGGESSELSLTMGYDTPNGSSVSLWRNDGQYWSRVRGAQMNQRANTVRANLTDFGVFAPLARARGSAGGPVTVTTDQPAPVQRTLTTVPQTPTATQTSAGETTASTAAASTASRPPTATEPSAMPSNASGGTTDVARGESDATTGTFGVGPVRLLFVLLGLVGLVALGLVAARERR